MTASRNMALGAPGVLAAPVGGAAGVNTRWCRGCRLMLSLIAGLMGAVPVGAQQILPTSGLEIGYHDIIADPPVWRVRYVAPELATDGLPYIDVAGDMEILCTQDALARITQNGDTPSRIVITLMTEPVEFGVMTPGVTQFFESFSVDGGLCIWEAF